MGFRAVLHKNMNSRRSARDTTSVHFDSRDGEAKHTPIPTAHRNKKTLAATKDGTRRNTYPRCTTWSDSQDFDVACIGGRKACSQRPLVDVGVGYATVFEVPERWRSTQEVPDLHMCLNNFSLFTHPPRCSCHFHLERARVPPGCSDFQPALPASFSMESKNDELGSKNPGHSAPGVSIHNKCDPSPLGNQSDTSALVYL